jgi:hypothetical protein
MDATVTRINQAALGLHRSGAVAAANLDGLLNRSFSDLLPSHQFERLGYKAHRRPVASPAGRRRDFPEIQPCQHSSGPVPKRVALPRQWSPRNSASSANAGRTDRATASSRNSAKGTLGRTPSARSAMVAPTRWMTSGATGGRVENNLLAAGVAADLLRRGNFLGSAGRSAGDGRRKAGAEPAVSRCNRYPPATGLTTRGGSVSRAAGTPYPAAIFNETMFAGGGLMISLIRRAQRSNASRRSARYSCRL